MKEKRRDFQAYNWKKYVIKLISIGVACAFVWVLFDLMSLQNGTLVSNLRATYNSPEVMWMFKLLVWLSMGVLMVFASWIMIRFVERQDRFHLPVGLTSMLLTLTFVIGYQKQHKSEDLFFTSRPIYRWVGWVILAVGVYIALMQLFDWMDRRKAPEFRELTIPHPTLIAFLILFVLWMPYVLGAAPGSICVDSSKQIRDFLQGTDIYIANPILVTGIYGVLFTLGRALGGDALGDMFLVMFQFILLASALSSLSAWIYRRSHSKKAYIVCLFLFGVVPNWGVSVQCILKDVVNVGFFIYFMITYADIVLDQEAPTKGKYIKLFVFAVLSALSKKFVDIAIVLGLIVLLLVKRKNVSMRKWIAGITAGLILILMSVEFITTHGSIFQPPLLREKYSLPMQQIARYCRDYGDEMTQEEIDLVDKVLDFDEIRVAYNSNISDPVKNLYHGEENMDAFWKIYFQLGKKHPSVYIQHMIEGNYRYMYPMDAGWAPYRASISTPKCGDEPCYEINYLNTEARDSMTNYVEWWMHSLLFRLFIGPGLYVDAFIILCCYAVDRKKKTSLLMFAPLILLTVGLLFTHVNGENRYAYPVKALIPLCATVVLMESSHKKEDEMAAVY